MAAGVDFVDLVFLCNWSKCPFAVAMVFGKCLFTLAVLTAGQVIKLLFLIAANHVDLTGLKHAACKNFK